MVVLRTAISSVSHIQIRLDMISFGRGLMIVNADFNTTTPFRATPFRVPDVTSTVYTTVFQNTYRLEDIGFLEVQDLVAISYQDVLGNGQLRLQISGDGGITFTTIMETAIFGVAAWTSQNAQGGGIWVSQINPGDNKLFLRMQTRADVLGNTAKARIYDSSNIIVRYRKKVLS